MNVICLNWNRQNKESFPSLDSVYILIKYPLWHLFEFFNWNTKTQYNITQVNTASFKSIVIPVEFFPISLISWSILSILVFTPLIH